jgi:hypothetical protein
MNLARDAEANERRKLRSRMIDIGYKTLAKELHPDKAGGLSVTLWLTKALFLAVSEPCEVTNQHRIGIFSCISDPRNIKADLLAKTTKLYMDSSVNIEGTPIR